VTSCFDTFDKHTDKSDIVRPDYGHKSLDTQTQTRSLLFIQDKRRPTTDSIIISPPPFSLSLCLLCYQAKMPRACPISNLPPNVDRSLQPLPLLLWLDLGPRPRVFHSPPLQ